MNNGFLLTLDIVGDFATATVRLFLTGASPPPLLSPRTVPADAWLPPLPPAPPFWGNALLPAAEGTPPPRGRPLLPSIEGCVKTWYCYIAFLACAWSLQKISFDRDEIYSVPIPTLNVENAVGPQNSSFAARLRSRRSGTLLGRTLLCHTWRHHSRVMRNKTAFRTG